MDQIDGMREIHDWTHVGVGGVVVLHGRTAGMAGGEVLDIVGGTHWVVVGLLARARAVAVVVDISGGREDDEGWCVGGIKINVWCGGKFWLMRCNMVGWWGGG